MAFLNLKNVSLISLILKENRITKEFHDSLRLNKSLSKEALESQEHQTGSSKVILKLIKQTLIAVLHVFYSVI